MGANAQTMSEQERLSMNPTVVTNRSASKQSGLKLESDIASERENPNSLRNRLNNKRKHINIGLDGEPAENNPAKHYQDN